MAVYEDLSGRSAGMRSLFVRGLATLAALGASTAFLYGNATREYEAPFTMTLLTDSVGEGILKGSEVKYHGYTIGSVQNLQPAASGKQKMTLLLDGTQAAVLTKDTTAKFVPSNSFGISAVELVCGGRGPRLEQGSTLTINNGSASVSLTGLLRSGGEFQRTLDQADMDHVLEVFRKHAGLIEPLSQALLDSAKIVTIFEQNEKLSQSLAVASSILSAANNIVPSLQAIDGTAKGVHWAVNKKTLALVNTYFPQLDAVFDEVTDILDRHQEWLGPLVNSITDIASPLAYALGSLAPEYGSLPGLIDKSGKLFDVARGPNSGVKLDVAFDVAPGVENALPAQQTDPESDPDPDADPEDDDHE